MADIAPRPEPSPEDIRASYGFVALLGDAVPEIRDILNRAVQEKWTPDRFVMSVASTNWWKNTPSAQREWTIRLATDPAQAAVEMATGADEIRRMTVELGVPMFGIEHAKQIWLETKITGFGDEASLRAFVSRRALEMANYSNEFGDGPQAGGRMGQLVQEMFSLAQEYGYTSPNLSQEVLDHARFLMSWGGTTDNTGWREKMINFASAYYAPYAEDIRGGKTLAEVAQPVVSRVAQLLEVNPDALNMNDPVLKKALTEWNAEGGVQRAYTLREIEDMTRKDSRWLKTDNAMDEASKMVNEIGQRFGMVAN
jgi:hypothetical protein